RIHGTVSLDRLRGDVRSEWDDDLTRLGEGAAFPGVEFYAAYLDPSRPSLLDHLPPTAVVVDFEPPRQLVDARTLLDETAMLAAAEAGGGELPRQFVLPTVHRLDDLGERPRLAVTAAEGTPDAADLGWFQGEPLVGQPRALAGLAERGDGAAVVFATEQDERLRALLDAAKVGTALREIDLDVDLEVEPLLAHAAVDIAAGCSQPGLGFHLSTDAELFGRVRRPSRAGRSERTRKDELTSEFTLDFANDELVVHVDHGIARFKGMRLIESEGAHREYLELEYAEGDRLFVPVENLDRVQKFLGGESAPALDRLLCGDVGFGKTELALRAAFKAAMSGKQVALLAPTTVLAQQHFHVFRERLKNFPVVVEMLSRFVDDETQARTVEGLKSGHVDIVVGTHRLLQRDVRFKRLGLLVIDEEHRFGVMQKERLKKLRTQLDVLSLSATPIPRTLHMAVGGIRDMSVIQ